MATTGFVLTPTRDPQLQARIAHAAKARGVSPAHAWPGVVDAILEGLMDTRDVAALNEIVSVAIARPVRVTNTCLTFQQLATGEDATYPVLQFLPDSIEVLDAGEPVVMTRELAQTIAQSLSLTLRNDTMHVMLA